MANKFKPGDKVVLSATGLVCAQIYPRLCALKDKVVTIGGYDNGFIYLEEEFAKYGVAGAWVDQNFDLAQYGVDCAVITLKSRPCVCLSRDLMAYGCPSAKGKPCRSDNAAP